MADLLKAIHEVGTPLYLFSEKALKDRIGYLREHLGDRLELCYAVKANTFLIPACKDLVERMEICSPGEARICLTCGVPEEKMVLSGVYKEAGFIEEMVREHPGIGIYTAESVAQYELILACARKYSRKVRVLLRFTSGNQFGMNGQEIRQILKSPDPLVQITGIQFFSGTQKMSLKKQKREIEKLEKFYAALKEECGFDPEELEFGAGLPVTYFEGETLEEDELLDGFRELLEPFTSELKVTIELGRSIAASCGTYVTTVVDRKQNKAGNYAILDGGMHQITYYGQMMAMKHPFVTMLPERTSDQAIPWNLCGSLCTINDILIKDFPVADLAIGDHFCFHKAGAYCMTEGISLFLSRDIPAIVWEYESGEQVTMRDHTEMYPVNTPVY